MPNKPRRARFNPDPVADMRSFSSPASSTSSLAPSPGPSTPPPLPNVAFSSPAHSSMTLSPYNSPSQPWVYTPSPIPQGHPLPYIPPAPLTPNVYIHLALSAPSLLYDMRSQPSHSNPRLSQAVLGQPASSPPLPSLALRVGNLPWVFTVWPDARLSPGNAVVTVQDVLLAIYTHLRTAVKGTEYEAMGKSRKQEIFGAFERRVGTDPVQRAGRGSGVSTSWADASVPKDLSAPSPRTAYGTSLSPSDAVSPLPPPPPQAIIIIIWRTEKEEVYYWYLLTPPGAILPGQVLYNISHQSTPPSPIIIPIASISSRHVIPFRPDLF